MLNLRNGTLSPTLSAGNLSGLGRSPSPVATGKSISHYKNETDKAVSASFNVVCYDSKTHVCHKGAVTLTVKAGETVSASTFKKYCSCESVVQKVEISLVSAFPA